MDGLSLLKEDHDKAKEAIRKIEGTNDRATKEREELFQALVGDLAVHERIEEAIFYPALEDQPKTKDLILESYVEHDVVDTLTDEISTIEAGDEKWLPTFKVFKENLEHHIKEEEEELFPKVKDIFSREQLEDLGNKMAALKEVAQQELMEEAR